MCHSTFVQMHRKIEWQKWNSVCCWDSAGTDERLKTRQPDPLQTHQAQSRSRWAELMRCIKIQCWEGEGGGDIMQRKLLLGVHRHFKLARSRTKHSNLQSVKTQIAIKCMSQFVRVRWTPASSQPVIMDDKHVDRRQSACCHSKKKTPQHTRLPTGEQKSRSPRTRWCGIIRVWIDRCLIYPRMRRCAKQLRINVPQ